MQIIRNGNTYRATKISGPRHNLLGLEVKKGDSSDEIVIIDLNRENNGKNLFFHEIVKEQVLTAIAKVNKEYLTNYVPLKIEFLSSDTATATIYKELTIEIIKNIIKD